MQCDRPPTGNEIQSFCTSRTSRAHPKYSLVCRVTGFRPNVTLEWTSSGIVKQPIGDFQRTLSDGTSEREVTISVAAKLDKDQNYTCTVKGKATNGTDRSATVLVLRLPGIWNICIKRIVSIRNIAFLSPSDLLLLLNFHS